MALYLNRNVPADLKKLRVACILDELSTHFFPYECIMQELSPLHWEKQLEEFQPHLLFVESAWHGYNNEWYKKIYSCSPELMGILDWCQERKVPKVFWNKEDPIHLSTFLRAASFFDYVFTTDMDCVPLYKRLLKHDRVDVLLFAAPVHNFDPIEKYDRKEAACFAGSYYARREERKQDFHTIVEMLTKNWDLEIYDRNVYPGNPDYSFPAQMQQYIVGAGLPVTKMDLAYKGYKLGITLNIVKHSSTMEARRAFELMSSNTIMLSNPCTGLKNLFGDLILFCDDTKKCAAQLRALLDDSVLYNKLRLVALRKVLTQHTYRHRMLQIYKTVFGKAAQSMQPTIAVVSQVTSQEEADRVVAHYGRQSYPHTTLTLITSAEISVKDTEIQILPHSSSEKSLAELVQGDWVAYFDARHYYGTHYLMDFVTALEYASVPVIGKSGFYAEQEGKLAYSQEQGTYVYVDNMAADRCIMKRHMAATVTPSLLTKNYVFEGLVCLALDEFHFCADFSGIKCTEVEDITVDQGVSMDEILKQSAALTADQHYLIDQISNDQKIFELAKNAIGKIAIQRLGNAVTLHRSQGQDTMDVFITDRYVISKLTEQKIITVYADARVAESAGLVVLFFDETPTQMERSFGVPVRSVTSITVPEGAVSFAVAIRFKTGDGAALIREVCINPHSCGPIAMEVSHA